AVDFSVLQNQPKVPAEFVWPENDVTPSQGDLDVPIIDLRSFFHGDSATKDRTATAVRAACETHGTFLVINHGIDSDLTESAHEMAKWFFGLPMDVKLKAERSSGTIPGYSVAHAERFSANLVWNETFSFDFSEGPTPVVEEFVRSKLGQDFEEMGKLYQKYCESMNRLSLDLMELMGTSLGLKDEKYYRKFFEDGCAIFRCNYYPPCKQPDRAL
ncbi:PREDICTED: gibberellin 20 oxidase 5-like, partial [Tarenaya hassleriana]|uniref:gibberellin 20 oxidase 5-like n=1 Tax=Tarenaya hassleriana TaxID=28532 RepID=UPI00053C9815